MGNSSSARTDEAYTESQIRKPEATKKETKDEALKALVKERKKQINSTWHLYGKAYDLNKFLKHHPGGRESLECARGLPDATALFESYHPSLEGPRKALDKYELGPSPVVFKTPHGYTFAKDGLYAKVRARVQKVQREAGQGSGNWKAGPLNTTWTVCHFLLLIGLRYAICYPALMIAPPLLLAAFNGVLRGMMITRTAHSASHYAFSTSPLVNRVAYRLAMMMMGGSSEHWTNQHVVRHHIETNIIPIDYDTMYPVKRILASYKPLWFHRYQHLYMWALYPITMIAWTLGDLAYAFHPRVSMSDKTASLTVSAIFMTHAWVLPYFFLPAATAASIIAVEVVVSSIFFSTQFVVNHEVTGTEGHSTDRDWGEYQIISSHDYGISPDSKPTWTEMLYCHMSGGLNNQIAHHLYPSTHFSHYPRITRAIREVCAEEKIAFQEAPTLAQALMKHYSHLKTMGTAKFEKQH